MDKCKNDWIINSVFELFFFFTLEIHLFRFWFVLLSSFCLFRNCLRFSIFRWFAFRGSYFIASNQLVFAFIRFLLLQWLCGMASVGNGFFQWILCKIKTYFVSILCRIKTATLRYETFNNFEQFPFLYGWNSATCWSNADDLTKYLLHNGHIEMARPCACR